jgi:hypothetical protein
VLEPVSGHCPSHSVKKENPLGVVSASKAASGRCSSTAMANARPADSLDHPDAHALRYAPSAQPDSIRMAAYSVFSLAAGVTYEMVSLSGRGQS